MKLKASLTVVTIKYGSSPLAEREGDEPAETTRLNVTAYHSDYRLRATVSSEEWYHVPLAPPKRSRTEERRYY